MTTGTLKTLCPHCFCETSQEPCPECGFIRSKYKQNSLFLNIGKILNGRYQVGGVIGTGGFGITYLAYDTKLKRKVAIKEYFPRNFASRDVESTMISVSNASSKELFSKGAEKFYEEACLVAQFDNNPNIVRVSDYFRENNTAYFTMELLEGQTLKSYLNGHQVLSPERAVWVADGISNALAAAHSKNILHRDISPGNIMLCRDGTVKLLDFGAARQFLAEGSQDLSIILTQGYAPLEQYQKRGKQGPWTDIYSLGATLYHALTLHTLDDPMSRQEDDSEFSSNAYGIEAGLWEVIKRATKLEIAERYRDIASFRDDIKKLPMKTGAWDVPNEAFHFVDFSPDEPNPNPTVGDTILEEEYKHGDETVLLRLCPHCSTQIPETSVYCPKCGKRVDAPNPSDSSRKKLFAAVLIAAVCVIALILFLTRDTDTDADSSSSEQSISAEEESDNEDTSSDKSEENEDAEDEEEQEEDENSVDPSDVDINAVEDNACSLKGMVQKKKNGSYLLKWKEGLTIYGLDTADEKVLARDVQSVYIDDEDLESGILDGIASNSPITVSGEIYFDDDFIYLRADGLKDEEGNPIKKKEEKQEKEEKETKTQTKPQPTADNSYVIANSDTVLLNRNDIYRMSLRDINYAKNEIYARHGRKFQSRELQNYFNGKSWYHGTIAPENFSESMLSDIEQKNAALLGDVEFSISPNGYQLDQ